MLNIVILDGGTTNPGDVSWAPLEAIGHVTAYDNTPAELVIERAKDADAVIMNRIVMSRTVMEALLVMSDKENAVKTWLSNGTVRMEPATPVFESNFTLDDIDKVFDLIHATTSFTTEVIEYPGNYVTATENVDAYYNPDMKTAIKRFLPYRYPVESKAAEASARSE